MTITVIEDKTIKSFKAEVVEIINGRLSCVSVGFNNFIKITPNIKHIFIDGVDVLPYYKKSEIKSESASKMTLEEFNKLYLGKAVHCKTEELANEFLEIADSFGISWYSGGILTKSNKWGQHQGKTYYRISNKKYIFYGNININIMDLPIIEFKGENKMKLNELKQGMICKLRNGVNFTVLNNGFFSTNAFTMFTLEEEYNQDLTHEEHKYQDIVEITYGNEVVFKRNESRWFVPEDGERYYIANIYGDVLVSTNDRSEIDYELFDNCKVFKTSEEAKKRLKQQQATLSVERWIAENDVEVDVNDVDVLKWFIIYSVERKTLEPISSYGLIFSPKQFILSSREKAEKLIEEREKELKIMLGVE